MSAPSASEVPRAEPFTVDVPEEVLEDLHTRLSRTRLADDFGNDDWSYGFKREELAEYLAYWQDGYDWRAQEREINSFANYRVVIDEIPVHFIHERGKGPNPVPLILTHGWPWTFWDFHKVIGPLTDPASFGGDPADSFDVIVPSLPGYGFSSPLRTPKLAHWAISDLWVRLMQDVLGYERFAAHGGDWGGLITSQLGHKYADRLIGVHLVGAATPGLFNVDRPWADLLKNFIDKRMPQSDRSALVAWESRHASHAAVHSIDPQTLAYALDDSPAGLCAWLLDRRRTWSDCGNDLTSVFSRDELLTFVTIYWVTRTFGTSARLYKDSATNWWTPSHDRTPLVEAPTGISIFTRDMPPGASWDNLSSDFNLQFFREHDRGGHFAPAEQPETLVTDLRDSFRPLR